MKIYVVQGSTGEYSDNREWLVKAFVNEKRAADLVQKASERAREVFAMRDDNDWYTYPRPERFNNEHDPNMQVDYTGTNYGILEVELDELPY